MLLTFILYLVALYATFSLSRYCLPPIMAGAAGILLGAQTNDIRCSIFMGISLYVTCFMGNSLTQASSGLTVGNEVLATLSPLSQKNAACLYMVKAGALILFFLLRIPTAPFQVPWQISLLVAGSLIIYNSKDRMSCIDPTAYLVIQTIAFSLCCYIAMNFGWVSNPVIGIICGLAVPKLLDNKPESNETRYSENQTLYTPYPRLVLALLVVWVTPALSMSVISNTMFRRGALRSMMQGFLEGAVEGMVFSLMSRGQVSTKSTFGDMLQLPILNWNSFTPTSEVAVLTSISMCIGIILPLLLVRFSKPVEAKHLRYFSILFITCQAVTDVSYLLPLFLLVGFGLHKLRCYLRVDQEAASLGILAIMI